MGTKRPIPDVRGSAADRGKPDRTWAPGLVENASERLWAASRFEAAEFVDTRLLADGLAGSCSLTS